MRRSPSFGLRRRLLQPCFLLRCGYGHAEDVDQARGRGGFLLRNLSPSLLPLEDDGV